MKTSLGIQSATRDRLRALKPEDMGWDAFLNLLLRASEPRRLEELLEAEQRMTEEEAADVARQRYFRYRRKKQHLLTADELRERVQFRRASLRIVEAAEALQKTTEAEVLPRDRILPVLESMDAEVHRARHLLTAHAPDRPPHPA